MKILKKYSIMIAVAIISLGLGSMINYWDRIGNVPSCLKSPACQPDFKNVGTLSSNKYGYPLTYREVVTYEPKDTSDYVVSTLETKSFSWPNIVINAVFWYALITLGISVYSRRKRQP